MEEFKDKLIKETFYDERSIKVQLLKDIDNHINEQNKL